MRLILALVAFLAAGTALAGSGPLSWTHDGKNTDGTPATLAGFRIRYGTGALDKTIDVPNGAVRAHVVPGLAPGTWKFTVAAYDTRGFESVEAGPVTLVVADLPPPAAPTTVTLTARSAYTIKQTQDHVAVVHVGTVPAQTSCDATRGVIAAGKPYYRVPTTAVTWAGSVRPVVVFADCS